MGRHRVREGEVLFGGVVFARDALLNQVVFVLEHLVDARFADVASFRLFAVDGVAEVLVVGGDGLDDGA